MYFLFLLDVDVQKIEIYNYFLNYNNKGTHAVTLGESNIGKPCWNVMLWLLAPILAPALVCWWWPIHRYFLLMASLCGSVGW